MSRVLLAWELGSNLGHLSRLLPLSVRLKARGYEVLVATRDVTLATEVLAASGIRFVQAPRAPGVVRSSARQPVSFADLLLLNGWESPATLWGLVQAWGNLLRLFTPSVLVLDYAPAALLAARILRLPVALVGTGFELPPLQTPFPVFPGFEGTAGDAATAAEIRAVENANWVFDAYGFPRVTALRDIFRGQRRWITTFAELDPYGPRLRESYVGPIGRLDRGESVEWPQGFVHRVLAYLRQDTPAMSEILQALSARGDTAVICAAPGVSTDSVKAPVRAGFQLLRRPVRLPALLSEASLFISYGPAASVAESLLSGVPQLVSPAHVEAQMTAARVQAIGSGLALKSDTPEPEIRSAVQKILHDATYKDRALEFANRYRGFNGATVADQLVDGIVQLAEGKAAELLAVRGTG